MILSILFDFDGCHWFNNFFPITFPGNWRIVDILIWHNADVNIKNNDDSAPIHIAAKEGSAIYDFRNIVMFT